MGVIPITILYAGLYGLLMVFLSIRVSFSRARLDVEFGDGGNPGLQTKVRVFGNFTEYVPMMLVLFLVLELAHTRAVLLHAIGVSLLLVRILHAVSLKVDAKPVPWRRMGRFVSALGTLLILLGMSLLLVKPYILP
ncbi:MAPEG family protein [Kordiimonas aestuarii]|uniref:MAPEG family protein n=1 Tax=Kordiimonas aestuarii TaxID=1005925 RepID=UPI0021CFAF30|nr:MAPEG family protein [Kordiimonas aestuarii]